MRQRSEIEPPGAGATFYGRVTVAFFGGLSGSTPPESGVVAVASRRTPGSWRQIGGARHLTDRFGQFRTPARQMYFDEPGIALEEARRLMDEGEYDQSLQHFVWFFDHATNIDPSFRGVRRSFALSDWKRLGDVYAPAMSALEAAFETACENSKRDVGYEAFQDAAAIAKTLNLDEKLFALLRELKTRFPKLARSVYSRICLRAVEKGYHREFCDLLTDCRSIFETELMVLTDTIEHSEPMEEFDQIGWAVEYFKTNCQLLKDHLRDCGRDEEVAWIQSAEERVLKTIA